MKKTRRRSQREHYTQYEYFYDRDTTPSELGNLASVDEDYQLSQTNSTVAKFPKFSFFIQSLIRRSMLVAKRNPKSPGIE